MDNNQSSIHSLPDEILLLIFRKMSASELLISLPLVCKRWSKLIASDSYTLKHVGMHHVNKKNSVQFFFLKHFHEMFHLVSNDFQWLLSSNCMQVDYTSAFYLCTQYSEIYEQIKILVISHNLHTYLTNGFTYINNLTTLIFYDVKFEKKDQYTLTEIGSVYSNVQSVLYIKCLFTNQINLNDMHNNFKQLKHFRLDHYSITHRLLEDLLTTHSFLKTIAFGGFTMTGDRWIDALTSKLKGRTIKSLNMNCPYFTDKCVNTFLISNFVPDKFKVIINGNKQEIPFFLTLN